jgi:hypothetical protein
MEELPGYVAGGSRQDLTATKLFKDYSMVPRLSGGKQGISEFGPVLAQRPIEKP